MAPLKRVVCVNDEVGGDAAVGPAADAELIGIGDALREGHSPPWAMSSWLVLVAQSAKMAFAESLAIAGGAARVGKENGRTVGGEKLGEMVEGSGVLPDGATVRGEALREFLAASKSAGL